MWGGQFLGIVNGRDKILTDLPNRFRIDPLDRSVIFHSEKKGSTMPIEKCTYRFIDITVELLPTGFELNEIITRYIENHEKCGE